MFPSRPKFRTEMNFRNFTRDFGKNKCNSKFLRQKKNMLRFTLSKFGLKPAPFENHTESHLCHKDQKGPNVPLKNIANENS